MTITEAQLAELERLNSQVAKDDSKSNIPGQARNDRDILLDLLANPLVAEVRRLRAENVALKAKDLFFTEYKSQIAESDATIAALRAETEAKLAAIRSHPLIAQLRMRDDHAGRWPTIAAIERESFLAILDTETETT